MKSSIRRGTSGIQMNNGPLAWRKSLGSGKPKRERGPRYTLPKSARDARGLIPMLLRAFGGASKKDQERQPEQG